MGDAVSHFEVGRLISAFRKLFDDLEADLAVRDAEVRAWLDDPEP